MSELSSSEISKLHAVRAQLQLNSCRVPDATRLVWVICELGDRLPDEPNYYGVPAGKVLGVLGWSERKAIEVSRQLSYRGDDGTVYSPVGVWEGMACVDARDPHVRNVAEVLGVLI